MDQFRIKSLCVGIGKVGPGGITCPCCTKGSKREVKPLIRRSTRRALKQELNKEDKVA